MLLRDVENREDRLNNKKKPKTRAFVVSQKGYKEIKVDLNPVAHFQAEGHEFFTAEYDSVKGYSYSEDNQ